MNKTDNELMVKYGITSKTKTIYSYKQHNYERLKDAISYAEIDINRHQQNGPSIPRVDEVDSSKRNDD
ncbi:hypothetical protein [Agaribacterium sp. ZY112]|uniref:hypothetical protein n=1 Tax=Agaribacterium sp. ZY112 TaxID=3233574 RepID=UPI00352422CA